MANAKNRMAVGDLISIDHSDEPDVPARFPFHLSLEFCIRILFLNNGGGGFADYIAVNEGTNIEAFLAKQVHGYKPGDLLIRVNRQPVARDYVLRDGDRVSATPVKIEGASLRRFRRLVKQRRMTTHRKFMRPLAA